MALPTVLKFNASVLKPYSQYLHQWKTSQFFVYKILPNQCSIHTSPGNSFLYEADRKGEYRKLRPKVSSKTNVRDGLKLVREEIELWAGEVKDAWDGDMFYRGMPGVVDKAFEFKTEKDLSKWVATSDKDNLEGESTCEFTMNENGKGLFTGNLCLEVPKDGKIKRTGYCNIRALCKGSFRRDTRFDWGMYTHLVMRVRGDGRTYALNLSTSGFYDITWNDVYTFALFTRGGPYWQYSKIPFSKFFFTSKGKIQDKQKPVPKTHIGAFGITIAERVPGPFYLEIDYIGLEYDPTHTEEFAYEMYTIPAGIAQN